MFSRFSPEYIKGARHVEPNQSILPDQSLGPCEISIFIITKYPDLVLSLLVAPSTRRHLDNISNHHPNLGTLQLPLLNSKSVECFRLPDRNHIQN
jgi:hypothetical protein